MTQFLSHAFDGGILRVRMVGGGKNKVFIKPLALGRMDGLRNGWRERAVMKLMK